MTYQGSRTFQKNMRNYNEQSFLNQKLMGKTDGFGQAQNYTGTFNHLNSGSLKSFYSPREVMNQT